MKSPPYQALARMEPIRKCNLSTRPQRPLKDGPGAGALPFQIKSPWPVVGFSPCGRQSSHYNLNICAFVLFQHVSYGSGQPHCQRCPLWGEDRVLLQHRMGACKPMALIGCWEDPIAMGTSTQTAADVSSSLLSARKAYSIQRLTAECFPC